MRGLRRHTYGYVVIFQMGKTQISRHLLCADPKTINTRRILCFSKFLEFRIISKSYRAQRIMACALRKNNNRIRDSRGIIFVWWVLRFFFYNLILIVVVQIISDTDDEKTDFFYKRILFIYLHRRSVNTTFDRLQHFQHNQTYTHNSYNYLINSSLFYNS